MTKPLPLFVTGTARSGSTLLSQMLNANKEVRIASDPYLHLFRSLRNAAVRYKAPPDLQESFDPRCPLQDYYFTDERIRLMDTIQASDLNIPYDTQEWDGFYEASLTRAEYECADLIPYLNQLMGSTYKEMFDNGLHIIAKARLGYNCKWVGFKEVWVIEFFASLARAYPEACFVVILRDPRAIALSNLAYFERDPSQVGHMLSYARHWRKYVAFSQHYQNQPLFANRLYFLKYEQLVKEPEQNARELCNFLGINYDPDMLDTTKYFHYSTGCLWQGNSTFEKTIAGISARSVNRWRTRLNPKVLKMIDFICSPDMKLVDYETHTTDQWPDSGILDYIIQSDKEYSNWRSDLGYPQQDYGFELFRRALLTLPERTLDSNLIRRSFLFEDVFTQIRQHKMG